MYKPMSARVYHEFHGVDSDKSPVMIDVTEVTAYWADSHASSNERGTVVCLGVSAIKVSEKFSKVKKIVEDAQKKLPKK